MSFVTLDVFIGLVLIYLLYSLLLSIIGEMIANWLGLRARTLRLGITKMLCDADFDNRSMRSVKEVIKDWFLYQKEDFDERMAGRFYAHSSIKYLAKYQSKVGNMSTIKTKPAYVHRGTFSSTMIDIFRSDGKGIHDWAKIQFAVRNNVLNFEPETHKQVVHLLDDAEDDMEAFIERLESWFDEMMDRVNGWYKRKISFILFVLGFIMAIAFNVDSIAIVKVLSKDKEARDKLVELAIARVESDNSGSNMVNLDSAYRAVQSEILQANNILSIVRGNTNTQDPHRDSHELLLLAGWLITALALSLGAPFWFDLLKKLVALRSSGINPDSEENKADRLKPKSPDNENMRGKNIVRGTAIDISLYKHKGDWEKMPGVIAVNREKDDTIKITHLKDYDVSVDPILYERVNGKTYKIKVEKTEGTFATAMAPEVWNPANSHGGEHELGTMAGVARDPYTGRSVLVTCGHVLSSTMTSLVSEHEPKIRASISAGHNFTLRRIAWTNYADCGMALFDEESDVDLTKYKRIPHPASPDLLRIGTKVKIYNRRSNAPVSAEVLALDFDYSFEYKKRFIYKSKELITIGLPLTNGGMGCASVPGDSGSLVTVGSGDQERSVGILIGGVGSATAGKSFVMPIKNVLNTLRIEII